MSKRNVERLRAWLETWTLEDLARGEFDPSLIDPEIVYEDQILPDHAGSVYRGYEGVAHAGRVWLEPFESFSLEPKRVFPVGDAVVSVHQFQGRFRETGIEFDVPLTWLCTFRDGRVVRWRAFPSEEEALEAAELRE